MVALLPHHSRVMICFSLQCINRQPQFSPCLLTNLHVFTAACSVSFSFCYSSSISRVLYIPCPMPSSRSRCLVLCSSLVFPLVDSLLSSTVLTKTPPVLSVFLFFFFPYHQRFTLPHFYSTLSRGSFSTLFPPWHPRKDPPCFR